MVPTDRRELLCCCCVSRGLSLDDRQQLTLCIAASEDQLHFIIPPNLPAAVLVATQSVLAPANLPPPPSVPSPVKWVSVPAAQSSSDAPTLTLSLPSSPEPPKQLVWHRKGDYLASVCAYNRPRSIRMSSLTEWSGSGGTGRCLDAPSITAPLSSTVQEGQGRCPAGAISPLKTALLRRCMS